MKCYLCNQDTLKNKKITHKITKEDKTFIIENVPVQSCNNCIEDFFSFEVTNNIEKIINVAEHFKTNDKIIIIDYEEIMKTINNALV